MTTKNIQLSIIAAFLFVLNALFYYCFNQIAFIINYSNRTYSANKIFSGKRLHAPILNAHLASTIENAQINTLRDTNSAGALQTFSIKAEEHPKNLTSGSIQSINNPLLAEAATSNSSPEVAASPTKNFTSGDDAMEVINVPPTKKVGHTNNVAVKDIPVIQSVSKDANVAGKIVTVNGQNSLMVYPTSSEWREMFVILNLGFDKVPPQSIVTPDFDGVVYPSLQKGELELHGTKYRVTLVKLKGHNATPSYPYFLSLAGFSSFYIFGDYSDKNKWYIFENNQVTQFLPSSEIHLF